MNRDPKTYNILVIEDNPGDQRIVEDLLIMALSNAIIFHADSYERARVVLVEGKVVFDVILLDLTLPDKGGSELVSAILRIATTCPIIALTGFADIGFSIESIALGMSDYLLKEDLTESSLYKSIIYSIERKKANTRLEASEKKYCDLFKLSPQPMWVCDANTLQFLDVNASAIESYGYDRAEFLELTLNEIVSWREQGGKDRSDVDHGSPGMLSYRGIWPHRRKNGELIQVFLYCASIAFADKTAILMLANDVTERIRYTSEIEKQNKNLQEISWMQSHMVRAPLARMMAIVSLIGELRVLPPDCKNLLGHFTESFHELDTVIREIAKRCEQVDSYKHDYGLYCCNSG